MKSTAKQEALQAIAGPELSAKYPELSKLENVLYALGRHPRQQVAAKIFQAYGSPVTRGEYGANLRDLRELESQA